MNQKKDSVATFPTTEKDKQKVAILKEVGTILKDVYQNPRAFYEVCATIYSGYYEDERVLLKDLLFPQYSPVYKLESFKKLKAETGLFKQKFWEAYNQGDYPNLKKAMHLENADHNLFRTEAAGYQDTALEIYSNSNGVSIYFPYSENFAVPLTTEYFDQINTYPGYKATIVSADRESDSGPGQEPYVCSSSKTTGQYCFRAVTVNDDYAELTATHIVGVGAEPARVMGDPPPPSTNVNRVYHGWSRLTQQLDKFISFSGNGGGSEMKIARISGYLQFQNQQVTNFTGDVATVTYKRKEIKKGQWKRVYSVWDADWVPDNLEQTYAIWEDDNEGTKTFTGSLGTTVRIDSSNVTATGNIGFNITVKTQDELVTQRKITRTAYFGAAKSDQGWGFNLCDKNGSTCRYDNTFLTTGNWPSYDGNAGNGAIWAYTWPFNSF